MYHCLVLIVTTGFGVSKGIVGTEDSVITQLLLGKMNNMFCVAVTIITRVSSALHFLGDS